MCWTDFPVEPSLMFIENILEKRKHSVSCSSVGEHARGQSRIARLFELIEQKLITQITSLQKPADAEKCAR